jgi:hypothetical protein
MSGESSLKFRRIGADTRLCRANPTLFCRQFQPEKPQLKPQDQTQARTSQEIVDARRSPRFPLQIDISVYSRTTGVSTGRTVDISESGISAMLTADVPVGEIVQLDFLLPSGPVNICATVRQRVAFRYGFHFVDQSVVNDDIWATCRQLALLKRL